MSLDDQSYDSSEEGEYVIPVSSLKEDGDKSVSQRQHSLVRSAHTRDGLWISKQMRDAEAKRVRMETRDFYNEHRLTAIALGKVNADDIVLKDNERHILIEKNAKREDKICQNRLDRMKETKGVFKVTKD